MATQKKPAEKFKASAVIREYLSKYPDMKPKEMSALIAKERGADFKAAGKKVPSPTTISVVKSGSGKSERSGGSGSHGKISVEEFFLFKERIADRDPHKLEEAFNDLKQLAVDFGGWDRMAQLFAYLKR